MTSALYFFDQFSRASNIHNIFRIKKDSKDLNQALYNIRAVLGIMNKNKEIEETHIPTSIKNPTTQTIFDSFLQSALSKYKSSIIPEILLEELNEMMKNIYLQSKTSQILTNYAFHHDCHLNNTTENLYKISLPNSLIMKLNSTWSDLIQNSIYKYEVKSKLLLSD